MIPKKLRWLFIGIIVGCAISDFYSQCYIFGSIELIFALGLSALYILDKK